MTDNEIIKALECCRDCKCKECPCYKNIEGEMRCIEIDEEEILDLINRQKAEIEKLKAENEVMKTNCNSMYVSMPNMAKAERTEAIKEFAHFVIDKSRNGVIYASDIPDLVKEMTEE